MRTWPEYWKRTERGGKEIIIRPQVKTNLRNQPWDTKPPIWEAAGQAVRRGIFTYHGKMCCSYHMESG